MVELKFTCASACTVSPNSSQSYRGGIEIELSDKGFKSTLTPNRTVVELKFDDVLGLREEINNSQSYRGGIEITNNTVTCRVLTLSQSYRGGIEMSLTNIVPAPFVISQSYRGGIEIEPVHAEVKKKVGLPIVPWWN